MLLTRLQENVVALVCMDLCAIVVKGTQSKGLK